MAERAVARLRHSAVSPDVLRAQGWAVDGLSTDRLWVHGEFATHEAVRAHAARDLPAGTAVSWMGGDGLAMGGFVVGHDEIDPCSGGQFPMFVLWRDNTQDEVVSGAELARVMRRRTGWLSAQARESGHDEQEIAAGRAEFELALEILERHGTFDTCCWGPEHHFACGNRMQPRALVTWDGFRAGWDGDDERPVERRRHPVHPDHSGAFLQVWRDGLSAGAAARRRLS